MNTFQIQNCMDMIIAVWVESCSYAKHKNETIPGTMRVRLKVHLCNLCGYLGPQC